MKRKISITLTSMLLFFGLFTPTLFAAQCTLKIPKPDVFTPWYKYLPGDDATGTCRVELPKKTDTIADGNGPGKDKNVTGTDIGKSVTLIAIAIIELLTHVAGLIAVGYVIYGGIQYITSQGEPDGLSNAKNTITNALIGFVIVLLAIAIVQFIGRTVS